MEWLFDLQTLKLLLVGRFPDGPIEGLLLTVLMGLSAIVFTTILGVPLALARSSKTRAINIPAAIFVEFFRAIPLVMWVFWLWFIPPLLGVDASGPITTVLALSIFGSAWVAETIRGSLRAVPQGQIEAAKAMGLGSLQTLRLVVLPLTLRLAVPMLAGRYVVTMKNTSLAFLIGIPDLTGVARLINVRYFEPVQIYVFLLVIYFVMNQAIIFVMGRFEARLWPERTEPPPVVIEAA